MVEATYIHYI